MPFDRIGDHPVIGEPAARTSAEIESEPAVSRPALSVVIASTQPWPEARGCLESLLEQARAVGAEVILVDGDDRALPNGADFRDIVWLKEPGASVFRLRALGLARARGEIVAMTEDHCRVRPGWCERLIEAHREFPAAAAIGGAVENGATEHLTDWAHFLIANGPFMLPLPTGESRTISGQANLSYKRRALPGEVPDRGVMEMLYNRALRARGEQLVSDGRVIVEHVQSLGFSGTCGAHFHNGRSIAGFRLQQMPPHERLARLGGCFILPPVMLWRGVAAVVRKRRCVRQALAGLPIITWLLCCHAAGEFIGYLAGPGGSPERLH